MIPKEKLVRIVQKMVADTGKSGIKDMCKFIGIEWSELTGMLTHNFDSPDIAMDVLMLGAAIGYLFAKGKNIHEDGHDSIV